MKSTPYNFIILTWLMLLSFSCHAAVTLPTPLVSAEWLAENKDQLTILDVRKQIETFMSEGHIEGARLVNVKEVRVTKTDKGQELTRMLPARKDFDAFMAKHGVNYVSWWIMDSRSPHSVVTR